MWVTEPKDKVAKSNFILNMVRLVDTKLNVIYSFEFASQSRFNLNQFQPILYQFNFQFNCRRIVVKVSFYGIWPVPKLITYVRSWKGSKSYRVTHVASECNSSARPKKRLRAIHELCVVAIVQNETPWTIAIDKRDKKTWKMDFKDSVWGAFKWTSFAYWPEEEYERTTVLSLFLPWFMNDAKIPHRAAFHGRDGYFFMKLPKYFVVDLFARPCLTIWLS